MTSVLSPRAASQALRPRIRDYGGTGLRSLCFLAGFLFASLMPLTALRAQDRPAEALPSALADAADRVLIPARPLNLDAVRTQIGYPAEAYTAGLSGIVHAHMLVDDSGRVIKFRVDGPSHPILQQAVAKHLSELSFAPATRGNKPLAVWVKLDFQFSIR